jgi:hypothetical protein
MESKKQETDTLGKITLEDYNGMMEAIDNLYSTLDGTRKAIQTILKSNVNLEIEDRITLATIEDNFNEYTEKIDYIKKNFKFVDEDKGSDMELAESYLSSLEIMELVMASKTHLSTYAKILLKYLQPSVPIDEKEKPKDDEKDTK